MVVMYGDCDNNSRNFFLVVLVMIGDDDARAGLDYVTM